MPTCILTTAKKRKCSLLAEKNICDYHTKTLNHLLNKIKKRKQNLKMQFNHFYENIDNNFEIANDQEINDLYKKIEKKLKKSPLIFHK